MKDTMGIPVVTVRVTRYPGSFIRFFFCCSVTKLTLPSFALLVSLTVTVVVVPFLLLVPATVVAFLLLVTVVVVVVAVVVPVLGRTTFPWS